MFAARKFYRRRSCVIRRLIATEVTDHVASVIAEMPWRLGRGLSQIGFVLRVCKPISKLDIDVTRWKRVYLKREPDTVEICRLAERTKPVEALSALSIKVNPGA